MLYAEAGDSCKHILTDVILTIKEIKHDSITIEFSLNDLHEDIVCDIEGRYISNNSQIILMDGRDQIPLADYLNESPIIFRTTDDVMIQGNEYCMGNPSAITFSSDNVLGIDWDSYGTNRKIEVNDPIHHPKGTSIQTSLKKILLKDKTSKYIIYDHSNGEMADFITIKEREYILEVTLFHVKKMTGITYNSSVDDIYEVAGQAVKSIIWLRNKSGFLSKVSDRRRSGHCNFLVGDYEDFKAIMRQNKQITGKVVIVQPSISKSIPMPSKIQEVLAASRYYINNSGKVKSLEIWGSL